MAPRFKTCRQSEHKSRSTPISLVTIYAYVRSRAGENQMLQGRDFDLGDLGYRVMSPYPSSRLETNYPCLPTSRFYTYLRRNPGKWGAFTRSGSWRAAQQLIPPWRCGFSYHTYHNVAIAFLITSDVVNAQYGSQYHLCISRICLPNFGNWHSAQAQRQPLALPTFGHNLSPATTKSHTTISIGKFGIPSALPETSR